MNYFVCKYILDDGSVYPRNYVFPSKLYCLIDKALFVSLLDYKYPDSVPHIVRVSRVFVCDEYNSKMTEVSMEKLYELVLKGHLLGYAEQSINCISREGYELSRYLEIGDISFGNSKLIGKYPNDDSNISLDSNYIINANERSDLYWFQGYLVKNLVTTTTSFKAQVDIFVCDYILSMYKIIPKFWTSSILSFDEKILKIGIIDIHSASYSSTRIVGYIDFKVLDYNKVMTELARCKLCR